MGYALYAGRSWKGDTLVADVEELHENDAAQFMSKETKQKKLRVPKEENFIFSCANGTVTLAGNGPEVRISNLGKMPKEEKNTAVIFTEKRTNQILQNNDKRETTWKRASVTVIMFKTDKKFFYVPPESSFPFPLTYIDVVRRTSTTLERVAGRSSVVLVGMWMIGNSQGHGRVSPSSLFWIHLKDTCGPG